MYMNNLENPIPEKPVPSEESGVQRIDNEKYQRVSKKIAAKVEEVYPNEDQQGKDNPDTKKVWGLSDEEEERVKKEYEVDERIARIQKEELDEQRKQEAEWFKLDDQTQEKSL